MIHQAGAIELTDADGALLTRPTVELTTEEAQALRRAARILRGKRFRMTIRCDACFEGGRGDGMRGEINSRFISLECRCRFLKYVGETL
jgi:hypothetical protein